jgi:hypothetical protein
MEMEISLESQIDFLLCEILKAWHKNFKKFKTLLVQKRALRIVVYVSLYVVLKP